MAYTPWLYYYQTGGTVAAGGGLTSPHTFYPTAESGNLESISATYATARDGGGTLNEGAGGQPGQTLVAGPLYYCWETFVAFDTSGIPDGATISAATLEVYGWYDNSTTNFTLQARTYDYGATLTTADFRTAAQLSAATLLASIAVTSVTFSAYDTWTESGTALRDAISKTGETRMVICSDRHVAGTTPTNDEYAGIYVTVTQPMKLMVTWA